MSPCKGPSFGTLRSSNYCRHKLNLFRLVEFRSSRSSPRAVHHHHQHLSHLSQTSIVSSTVSGTGYCLFRTDIFSSGQVFFIPSGCRTSEAFQVYLYMSTEKQDGHPEEKDE